MNEILLINDHSSAALNAGRMAMELAQLLNKNILLANIAFTAESAKLANAGSFEQAADDEDLLQQLQSMNLYHVGFKPMVEEFDAAKLTEQDLVNYINRRSIFMVVQPAAKDGARVNIRTVLSRILCPLLVVPEIFRAKPIERIMYLTDLRYCQLPIVNYLSGLDHAGATSILIAHICNSGLPDLDGNYANDLFINGVNVRVKNKGLLFSHIKERNMDIAVDTMIHVMQADLLVCQHNWFHFNELLGGKNIPALPEHITVPLLVFPS